MDLELSPQLLTVIGVIAASAITGLTAMFAAARSASVSRDNAALTAGTQVDVAVRTVEAQFAMERDRRVRHALEEAYEGLNRWLDQLERTVDEVYRGVYAEQQDVRRRCLGIVQAWPWETLAPPAYAAVGRFAWSDAVLQRLRHFEGDSARFQRLASQLLSGSNTSSRTPLVRQWLRTTARERARFDAVAALRQELWEERNVLMQDTQEVRRQIRAELISPHGGTQGGDLRP